MNVQTVSKKLGEKLASELKYDKNKTQIMVYGANLFFSFCISLGLIMLLSSVFGVLKEALVITIVASLLRKYSGGVHASSPLKCGIIGSIFAVLLSYLSRFISNNVSLNIFIIFSILLDIISFYTVYKLAPVDSAAKRIKKEEKKLRLKKISLIVMGIFTAILVSLSILIGIYQFEKLYIYLICMVIGFTYQSFTLTKVGNSFFSFIDLTMSKLNLFNFIKKLD